MDSQNRANTGMSQEVQFDFKRFLAIIIRRRLLIAAIALPIILMVTIGTLRTSSSVTAGTMIMVETRQPENPVFAQRVINDDVIMSTAAQIAMSSPVAQGAALLLEDSISVFREEDPLLVDIRGGNHLVGRLMDRVDCGQVGESNVLHLSYSHSSARFALAAVEALAESFLTYNIERQQNPSAIAYYSDQIRAVQAEVDSILKLKSDVLDESGIVAFASAAQHTVSHIRTMEQLLFNERSTRRGIEARLEKIKDTIATNPNYIPADSRFEDQKRRLEAYVAELSSLQVKYKDDTVWVRRQLSLIEDAQFELNTQRMSYISELEIILAEVRGREASLAEVVETQTATLNVYPQAARLIESYEMQIESRRDLLESLQFKKGEVRLKSNSDQRISNLVPLNQPTINKRIGSSKKILYIVIAIVFALVFGLIAAIFVDNQDHRIYDRRQANQMLDVPVLGTLSSTNKN